MNTEQVVNNLIVRLLKELARDLEDDYLSNPDDSTKIFGSEGHLDSLALVSFVADLEEGLSDKLDKQIILANEKTMSSHNSPFKDVATLRAYILEVIQE